MKFKTFYECETCGKTSTNFDMIQICEGSHLGLTLEEYRQYGDLKEAIKAWSVIVNGTNNERNRYRQEQAINKLLEFEKEHNIAQQN